jgi:hypothetical protein
MVRSAPGFTGAELDRQTVLLLPIAVTDDYGDERTGIVLDHESREQAARLACRSGAGLRADVRIVCFDEPSVAPSSSDLRDISTQFAKAAPISADSSRKIARVTGARFALLFRPESVSASQKVRPGPSADPLMVALFGKQLNRPEQVEPRGSVKTTRVYTLSSELVDLRDGRVVRAAVRRREASTSSLEAPPASQQLHAIMHDLIGDLLDRD